MVTLQGQRDPAIVVLRDAARALSNSSDARRAYAASWQPFGETFSAALLAKHSGLGPQLDHLSALFVEVAKAHSDFAQDEKRASEDIADIPARFEVVFRLNEEYLKRNANLEREKDSLRELEEARDPRMEEECKKRKEMQLAALEATKEAVRALIEAREKYKRFKLRKTREGWRRYGAGLTKLCQREASLFGDIKKVLLEIKSAARIPAPAAVPAPAPVPEPVPVPVPAPGPVHAPARPSFLQQVVAVAEDVAVAAARGIEAQIAAAPPPLRPSAGPAHEEEEEERE